MYLCVCVCANLVLQEQHHVSGPLTQNVVQVGSELLLLHDVTCCWRSRRGDRDPDGRHKHQVKTNEILYINNNTNGYFKNQNGSSV